MSTEPTTSTAPSPRRPAAARTRRGRRGPATARRRDGIALTATGRVPDRVRALVLSEYHAQQTARARERIIARVHAGTLPLTIPYGYRCSGDPDLTTADPDETGAGAGPDRRESDPVRAARTGRARPLVWEMDPATAYTVRVAASWIRSDIPPGEVAARLAGHPAYPYPLTLTGARRGWTAASVRAVLLDPALTGHSVWGRTRGGRPVPAHEWAVSPAPTHPAILPTGLWQAVRRRLTPDPFATTRPEPPRRGRTR